MNVDTKDTFPTTTGPGGQKIQPNRRCSTAVLPACLAMVFIFRGEMCHAYPMKPAVSYCSILPMAEDVSSLVPSQSKFYLLSEYRILIKPAEL